MSHIGRNRSKYIYTYGDYVRFSSLELVSNEIYEKNIQGNVAELGVYRGDFAQHINESFPDRKLYLFDTFDGFDKRDIVVEERKLYSKAKENEFRFDNIDNILSKMKHKEICKIMKGYFPETAKGLKDEFVFVSIDVDLYEPIYNGLKYFYPRLKNGGYIFVHDFNNIEFSGVKKAVKKYSEENKIPYFTLSDGCGSVVLMK